MAPLLTMRTQYYLRAVIDFYSISERAEAVFSEIEKNNESQEIKHLSEAKDIENVLEKIDQIVDLVEKSRKKGILTTAEAEEKYDEIVDTLEDLIEIIKIPENAHTFLTIKGVEKILSLIVETGYERLKKQVLIVIKTLFNVAPSTTTLLIPVPVVDKLLDIFEHDPNLALKTHAIDIMYVWLPNNPRVQARVMKVKGLEPFYDQVSKLDASVIYTLLDLFNTILEEHVRARNDTSFKSHSLDKKLYQQIGLIERMSTPQVCTGLLNIFEIILPFKDKNEQFTKVIIELMKNIKPFCLKMYLNKSRPLRIFKALKSYFADNMGVFVKLSFDSTEVMMLLEEYSKKLNDNARDEF
ncbi:uncharacterized protein LOC123665119 [Melitaea cinxia]|uniref:uncharacterized protein LOC123665119 n=1 Tax=Melitaea cinxia TaxID=113334 RepID=UPI001E274D4B|nr:uncharacterized protein LOC123665119 [Melitaea cinxia]